MKIGKKISFNSKFDIKKRLFSLCKTVYVGYFCLSYFVCFLYILAYNLL